MPSFAQEEEMILDHWNKKEKHRISHQLRDTMETLATVQSAGNEATELLRELWGGILAKERMGKLGGGHGGAERESPTKNVNRGARGDARRCKNEDGGVPSKPTMHTTHSFMRKSSTLTTKQLHQDPYNQHQQNTAGLENLQNEARVLQNDIRRLQREISRDESDHLHRIHVLNKKIASAEAAIVEQQRKETALEREVAVERKKYQEVVLELSRAGEYC